jgi:hypothetical protein
MTDDLEETLLALSRRAAEAEGLQVAWIELKRHGGVPGIHRTGGRERQHR